MDHNFEWVASKVVWRIALLFNQSYLTAHCTVAVQSYSRLFTVVTIGPPNQPVPMWLLLRHVAYSTLEQAMLA
jgi:hypothetical protein